ncbi:ABC transporter substrate-binding protein (plasmid) [Azospirillum humicireducens]|uniref:ABC transporter substrate-binding protein n=1 Tax=Azospirillum humicireducens TaxID=1226968 RepID=A0A2R4VV71_9PROT|nr:ABC transporter substrate-binding protein [Azospirillum humicireducens]AWB08324.1 ABC transporter substrate-binding protein [Azospirillum humicireducens]
MRLDRRTCTILLGLTALAPVTALGAPGAGSGSVVDAAGRRVPLAGAVRRIVLLDAVDVLSMAVLHPDPSALIVGWAGVDRFDSDLVRRLYERGSDGGPIPVVGAQTGDTLSLERILALEPDLVVATAVMEPGLGEGGLTRRLEAAGIPVIFSSAASNRQADAGAAGDPFGDMARTLRMWGAVLGKGDRADAFIGFVEERLATVTARLAGAPAVKAYLEVQSTYDDCCWTAGRRIWGDLLARAGGRNLSAVEGPHGSPWYAKLAAEQLMTEAPEVYIASGGAFGAGIRPGIGPGLDPEKARAGLRRLTGRTGFDTLPAVRNRRVHGVWTGLLTAPPLNILFVEAVAKWLHPDAFADADPADTMDELNRRFLAQPLAGPCWLSLSPATAADGR